MANRLFSSSTVYYLRQLLEEFHRGEIILPRFHRPLVWNNQKRLELFDSIRKGIPLGSFTIWETRSVDIQPMSEFGPFALPKPSGRTPRRYLLDGEQRLMTLYLALYRATRVDANPSDEEADPFDVFFDLDEVVFVTGVEKDLNGDQQVCFPLRGLFEFRSVLRFQRELTRHVSDRNQLDRYVELVDEVAQALMECTLAVTTVVTNELTLATEVFTRVNSQGVPMSTAHLVNALTWRGSSSLFDTFDEVRESLEEYPHWQSEENLSNECLLLVSKRLMGYSVDDEDFEVLAHELSTESSVLERLKQSLLATAQFLHERGLRNPAHVPEQLMIVMLAKIFEKVPTPSRQARDRMEDWLWFIAYTESLDSDNRSDAYQSLELRLLMFVQGKPLRMEMSRHRRKLPLFDFKQSRSKTFAWMLARRMMKFDGGKAADALAEYGVRAVPKLRSFVPFPIAQRSALRILAPAGKAFYLSLRAGRVNADTLEAQAIPREAISKLREDPPDLVGFVNIRQRALNELEDERFAEIVKRLFPDSA